MNTENQHPNSEEHGGTPFVFYLFLGAVIFCVVVIFGYLIFGI